MDIIDQAEHQEQMWRDIQIRKSQLASKIKENTTGKCWCCGDDVINPRRFCDKDCADIWSKRNQ